MSYPFFVQHEQISAVFKNSHKSPLKDFVSAVHNIFTYHSSRCISLWILWNNMNPMKILFFSVKTKPIKRLCFAAKKCVCKKHGCSDWNLVCGIFENKSWNRRRSIPADSKIEHHSWWIRNENLFELSLNKLFRKRGKN